MAALLEYVGRLLWSFLGFSGAEREKSSSQDFPVDFRRARRHITDAAFVLARASYLIGLREAPAQCRSWVRSSSAADPDSPDHAGRLPTRGSKRTAAQSRFRNQFAQFYRFRTPSAPSRCTRQRGIHHTNPNPITGYSVRSQRPRPLWYCPDRNGKDRRLCTANTAPARRPDRCGAARRLPRAGAEPNAGIGEPDSR